MKNTVKFGENLREIRTKREYTQERLGNVSGLSRRIISHYETLAKCPSIEKVAKIADVLDVSITEIIGNQESPARKFKSMNASSKILKKLRTIEELPTRDQNTIFSMINSMVEKNKLRQQINKDEKKK
jgi:transcriptional regulator with XRE-family HTH domain